MHIYRASLNTQGANFASTASGERSAAAQRAAEVRKRLLKNAQSLGINTPPEESMPIGNWLNVCHNQSLADDQYSSSGKDPDLG